MRIAASIFTALLLACGAFAQNAGVTQAGLSQPEINRIIKAFSENERLFRQALSSYAFSRKAEMRIIGLGGQVTGSFRRDSFMTFTPSGERIEKVLFAPVATTPPGFITAQDLEDLGGVNPFALEPEKVDQYNFAYVGTEKVDELDLYVFDVTPKVVPEFKKAKTRFFTGRIWVDKDDLMIVRSKGKGVPEDKNNKFPIVETTRDQVDGKYWFPIDARSDDELVFGDGSVVKIRFRVRFGDYTVGRSEVRILDDVPDPTPTPTPAPTPKKP